MNKERLIKFVYILLRERLTFGDLEAIMAEVNSSDNPETLGLVKLYVEEVVDKLLSSGLKCYDSMCNTEFDDVRIVKTDEGQQVPMCADCRKRNPQAVIDNH